MREAERTCVACRRRRPKAALLRITAGRDGVAVDPRGRAPGRGAYVCREAGCAGEALRGGRLARALRRALSREDLARLGEEIERELA